MVELNELKVGDEVKVIAYSLEATEELLTSPEEINEKHETWYDMCYNKKFTIKSIDDNIHTAYPINVIESCGFCFSPKELEKVNIKVISWRDRLAPKSN